MAEDHQEGRDGEEPVSKGRGLTTRSRDWVLELEALAVHVANDPEALTKDGTCNWCKKIGQCKRDCLWVWALGVLRTLMDEAKQEDMLRGSWKKAVDKQAAVL